MSCDLDKQSVKISALASGNVSKYKFLTSKDIFLEKHFLADDATMKKILNIRCCAKKWKGRLTLQKKYQKLDDIY